MDWTLSDGTSCLVNDIPTLQCIVPLFENIVFWAITFSGITAVIFIIWAGVKYITSRGDAKQVEGARKTLTFAIIGLILVLSAAAVVGLLSSITGVGCINQFGFSTCSGDATSSSSSTASQLPYCRNDVILSSSAGSYPCQCAPGVNWNGAECDTDATSTPACPTDTNLQNPSGCYCEVDEWWNAGWNECDRNGRDD